MRNLLMAHAVGAALLAASAVPVRAVTPVREPLRVLLVGNSYTRFNIMPTLLRRVGASVRSGPRLRVETVAKGGYTLRMHWRRGVARRRILQRHYSHVVLQDHSLRPVDRAEEMSESVNLFVHAIEAAGARPVLYETWPRRAQTRFYRERRDLDGPGQMHALVSGVYRSLAHRHGARLAPVGSAFFQALHAQPEISLYKRDGTHPSLFGSYLAACVIYGAVTGVDPRRAEYVPGQTAPQAAHSLRVLAHSVLAASGLPLNASPSRARRSAALSAEVTADVLDALSGLVTMPSAPRPLACDGRHSSLPEAGDGRYSSLPDAGDGPHSSLPEAGACEPSP